MFSKEEIKEAWGLAKSFGINYFGSSGHNNKTIKSDKKTQFLTYLIYLAPSDQAGTKYNTCPSASEGCKEACLFTSGRGAYARTKNARIKRTKFWFEHREEFKACVYSELKEHLRKCKRLGVKPAARLNGTSDIVWERVWPEVFDAFPSIQFYDYSKIYKRMLKSWKMPSNYQLVFSRSESNEEEVKKIMRYNPNANIAVVFDKLPDTWRNRRVIDGDEHDMRPLDDRGVIVGLKAKGKARCDKSGFVVSSIEEEFEQEVSSLKLRVLN